MPRESWQAAGVVIFLLMGHFPYYTIVLTWTSEYYSEVYGTEYIMTGKMSQSYTALLRASQPGARYILKVLQAR